MRNFSHAGRTCTFIAPYAVTSGQGFQVGAFFAVANADAAQGVEVEGDLEGVFDITKSAGVNWTPGAKLYWDNTARSVTNVATNNLLIGGALKAQINADTSAHLRLNGTVA